MTLRKALLAASLLAFPIASMAQPIDGVYVSAGIGAAMLGTTNVVGTNPRTASASTALRRSATASVTVSAQNSNCLVPRCQPI